MERSRYEPFPNTGKGEAAVVNYHQISGLEDDDGFSTRYSPGSTSEIPKTVLEKGLHFSKFVFHILALATTAAVVGVNFATVYGWDEGSLHFKSIAISDNQVNNLLQFAAKLHEILIVGSLTSIVMYQIRKRLISKRGLPFGLLSSGYQVNSIEFLFSRGLRSAFTTDLWLTLTVAATIILVNVVGPSSAIVVIPRLNWWLQLYLNSSLDELYPTNLGPPDMKLYQGCDTVKYTSDCPGAAFEDLKNWAASWNNNGMAPNISMTEPSTNIQRGLLIETQMHYAKEGNVTKLKFNPNLSITTTLTQPMLELIGLFWAYIQENPMGLFQKIKKPMLVSADTAPVYAPVVKVECAWFNYSEAIKSPGPDNPVVSFPVQLLDRYTGTEESTAWAVHPSLWNFTRPKNATNFTWVDLSSYSDGDGPGASLGALVTLPTVAVDDAGKNSTFWDISQQSFLIPCLINAKWAAARIQYEPTSSNQIVQNFSAPNIFGFDDGSISNTIHISPEWAALLNVAGIPSTSASGESLNTTMVEALLSQFVISDTNPIYSPYMALGAKFTTFVPPPTNNVLPASIAAVVAEGLSRLAYNRTTPYLGIDKGSNSSTFKRLTQQMGWNSSGIEFANMSLATFDAENDGFLTPIDFNIERHGYGYGWRGVVFGLAVLLTHAAMAIGHILYLTMSRVAGARFTSTAWGQLGEMLALALHSGRARELQNVGGGVEKTSTWEMRVRVRERGGDRLELVVGGEGLEEARPQLDKKYH